MPLPEMTSPKGEPVGAVFGFTRDLLFLLEEKKPDYLFCAFDLPGKTFRHAMYDSTRMQRAEMPDDLAAADSRHPPCDRRAGHSGPGLRVVRGRRHSGHRRPANRASSAANASW